MHTHTYTHTHTQLAHELDRLSAAAAEAQAEKELLVAERSLILLNLKVYQQRKYSFVYMFWFAQESNTTVHTVQCRVLCKRVPAFSAAPASPIRAGSNPPLF